MPLSVEAARVAEDLTTPVATARLDPLLVRELERRSAEDRLGESMRVVVNFDHKPGAPELALLAARGASGFYTSHYLNFVQFSIRGDRAADLANVPGATSVEFDVPVYPELEFGARAVKARTSTQFSPGTVHDLGFRGEGMVVAILDTGVDNLHESLDDLDDNPATNDPKLVQKTDPGTGLPILAAADTSAFEIIDCVNPTDDVLHGTHVAGIAIGTGGPTGQFMGVAPHAKLVEVKIDAPPGASISGITRGLEWVIDYNEGLTCYGDPGQDTVDVINISFGSSGNGGDGSDSNSLVVDEATRHGITVFLSAGNCGPQGDCNDQNDDEFSVGSPGVSTGGIAVASSNDRNSVPRADDSISGFSSRGPRDDDGDLNPFDELKPDIAAPGDGIVSAAFNTQNQYVALSGTSMASPMAAGVGTLLLQVNSLLKPTGPDDVPVRDLLIQTAETKSGGQKSLYDRVGDFGKPWNNAWGHGLIDAHAAALIAQGGGLPLSVSVNGPYDVGVGLQVDLVADPAGGKTPYAVAWDLDGDGLYDDASGASVTTSFAAPGVRSVSTRVTDANGVQATASTTATVRALTTLFSDDVEGATAWTIENDPGSLDGWHVTEASSHSSSHSWYHGNDVLLRYPPAQLTRLVSPAIDPGSAPSVHVAFWRSGHSELDFDFLHVEARPASGTIWTPLASFDGATGWEEAVVTVPATLLSSPIQVSFLFDADELIQDQGWNVDDVRVLGTQSGAVDNQPPTQVVGLTVADPALGGKLNLAWTPATDNVAVASYKVYRSTTSGGPYTTVANVAATSFQDSGLTDGTTYFYRVSALDTSNNEGPQSAEASGLPSPPPPDTTAPSQVVNLAAAALSDTKIKLTWDAASDNVGVDHYRVYRSLSSGTGFTLLATTSTTSLTDAGLTPATDYFYIVSAVDAAGNEGTTSLEAHGTTLATGAIPWPRFHNDVANTAATGATGGTVTPLVLAEADVGEPVRGGGPVAADLDGDGDLEILVGADFGFGGVLRVHAYQHDGTGTLAEVWNTGDALAFAFVDPVNDGALSAPHVVDLDGDGQVEVVVSGYYQTDAGAASLNIPILAVLDGATGAVLDYIGDSNDDSDATAITSSVAVGDVDGDAALEIVSGGISNVAELVAYEFDAGAQALVHKWTFDEAANRDMDVSPALAELDAGHAGLEIVTGDVSANTNGLVYVFRPTDGSPGTPSTVQVNVGVRGVAAGDLDADGAPEVAVHGRTGASSLVVVEYNDATNTLTKAASRNTGTLWNTPAMANLDGQSSLEIVSLATNEFIDDTTHDGSLTVTRYQGGTISALGNVARPGDAATDKESPGGAALADFDGDGSANLVFGSNDGVVYAYQLSPAPLHASWSLDLEVPIATAPALADATNDGLVDILVATTEGRLVVVGATAPPPPDVEPPVQVTGLDVANPNRNGRLALSWNEATDNVGVDHYHVKRSLVPGGPYVEVATPMGTTYTDFGLTNGVEYFYVVSAEDAAGNEGPESLESSGIPTGPPGTVPWPMFHNDASHAAFRSNVAGIEDPDVLNEATLPGPVRGGPVVADVDPDGRNDIVVVSDANTAEDAIVARAYERDFVTGELVELWSHAVPFRGLGFTPTNGFATTPALGDFDLNGVMDVAFLSNYIVNGGAVTANDAWVTVLNGETGTVEADVNIVIVDTLMSLVVGNVDTDPRPELVFAHIVGGTTPGEFLTAYEFDGSALVQNWDELITADFALRATPALAELDATHDGLEVVLGEHESNTVGRVHVFEPSTSGPGAHATATVGSGVMGVAAADLDGDGALEIVANGRTDPSLFVLEYDGATLTNAASANAGDLWNTASLANLDADARLEIVTVEANEFTTDVAHAGTLRVHAYDGADLLLEAELVRAEPSGVPSRESPGGAAIMDVDTDGTNDIVFASEDGFVYAYRLDAASLTEVWSHEVGGVLRTPSALADATGDAFPEIVIGNDDGVVTVLGSLRGPNRAPVIAAISDQAATEDTPFSVTATATDEDGDAATWSLDAAPTGMTVDASTGTVSWTPTNAQAAQAHAVTVRADDGFGGSDTASFNVVVANTNDAPFFTSTPLTTATEEVLYQYQATGHDPDQDNPAGDTLKFTLVDGPVGMSVGATSGIVKWTPTNEQAGQDHGVTLELADVAEVKANQAFSVFVTNTNDPPLITTTPGTTASEGIVYTYDVDATDDDLNNPSGESLTFALTTAPAGMTINAATGVIEWTPTGAQTNQNPHAVTAKVTDAAGASDAQTWQITVAKFNDPPVLAAIGAKTVQENHLLQFDLSATDPESDAVAFTMDASGLPPGNSASLDDHGDGTATFSWTPTFDHAGAYTVTFSVSDGSLSDTEAVTITVENVNRAPVLGAIGNKAVDEGDTLAFTIAATDADGDALTFTATGLPAGAALDGATGDFTWTPGFDQSGNFNVNFQVTDGSLSDSEGIVISVGQVNRPPVLNAIGNKQVDEDQTLTFTVSGSDPDGDALTFSATGLPTGASFNAGTKTFTWKPTFSQAGTFPGVQFKVSDGELSDAETITITVKNVNRPPTLDPIGAQTIKAARTLHISVSGSDPDQTPLTFAAAPLPPGATFNAATKLFTWEPTPDQEGTHVVTFAVSDGSLSDSEAVTITVDENLPPEIVLTVPTRVDVLKPGSYSAIHSTDPEAAGPITFEWDMDFNPAQGFTVDRTGTGFEHTYTTLGTPTVAVRATDADGITSIKTTVVEVDDWVTLDVQAMGVQPYSVLGPVPGRAAVRFFDGTGIPGETVHVEVYSWPLNTAVQVLLNAFDVVTGPDGTVDFTYPQDVLLVNAPGRHLVKANVTVDDTFLGDNESATDQLTYEVLV